MTIHEMWKGVNKLFLAAVLTTGVLSLAMWIAPGLRPDQYESPFTRALPIWVTCCAVHYFVVEEMIKPQQRALENAKRVFDKSIQD